VVNLILPLTNLYVKYIIKRKKFIFDGNSLPLFFHSHNNFGLTERSIEIPIVKHLLGMYAHETVLEIGNVSNYYYDEFKDCFNKKDTVDQYESGHDVINLDIRDFKPNKKYDFIFSISTFEHMDSDGGRNAGHYERRSHNDISPFSSVAFDNMNYVINNLLKKGGMLVITFLLDYLNDEVGHSLHKKETRHFDIDFLDVHCVPWREKDIVILVMQK